MHNKLTKLAAYLYCSENLNEVSSLLKLATKNDKKKEKDLFLYTAVHRDAIDTIKEYGLLSGERLYESKMLLSKARPDAKAREEWIEKFESSRDYNIMFKGINCFFSLPIVENLPKKHPIIRDELVFIKINLSAILDDYNFLEDLYFYGVELSPYDKKMSDEQYLGRERFLSLEEVSKYIKTKPRKLWSHYNNPKGTHYASDVPHVVILLKGGCIDQKYLEFPKLKKKL